MSGRNDKPRPPRHWVKRQPKPSRPPAPPPRVKPGFAQAAMAAGAGLLLGMLGGTVAGAAGLREGLPGMLAGAGFCLGAVLVWRAFGGTMQDFRDLWR